MIHTKFGATTAVDDELVDYHCVGCSKFVTRESRRLLAYLVLNREALYCDECDPLPDVIPEALRDCRVVACLLGHNSTSND